MKIMNGTETLTLLGAKTTNTAAYLGIEIYKGEEPYEECAQDWNDEIWEAHEREVMRGLI